IDEDKWPQPTRALEEGQDCTIHYFRGAERNQVSDQEAHTSPGQVLSGLPSRLPAGEGFSPANLRKDELVNDQWSLLLQLFSILGQLLAPLIQSAVSWLLLLVWLAWWLWAVNWKKVWPVLAQGGWLVVVLLMIIAALPWSEIAPDSGYLFGGLVVSSAFWRHLIVVAILVLLA